MSMDNVFNHAYLHILCTPQSSSYWNYMSNRLLIYKKQKYKIVIFIKQNKINLISYHLVVNSLLKLVLCAYFLFSRLPRIMQSQKAVQLEKKVDLLSDKFKNYLRPMFEEWKRVVPIQIQDSLANPLFTVNQNKTIGLNFKKEVILFYF